MKIKKKKKKFSEIKKQLKIRYYYYKLIFLSQKLKKLSLIKTQKWKVI